MSLFDRCFPHRKIQPYNWQCKRYPLLVPKCCTFLLLPNSTEVNPLYHMASEWQKGKGEKLDLRQWGGIGLITAGVVMLAFRR